MLLYMHLNIIGDDNSYVNNANPVRTKIQSTKQEILFHSTALNVDIIPHIFHMNI